MRAFLRGYTEQSEQAVGHTSRHKHISHPDVSPGVPTSSDKRHMPRVTQAVTLPNAINKHVGMLIKKGRRRKEGRVRRQKKCRMSLISVASHVDESEMWNQTCESEEREHAETRCRLLTPCGCECWLSPWHISNLCEYAVLSSKVVGGFSSHKWKQWHLNGCVTPMDVKLWVDQCSLTTQPDHV